MRSTLLFAFSLLAFSVTGCSPVISRNGGPDATDNGGEGDDAGGLPQDDASMSMKVCTPGAPPTCEGPDVVKQCSITGTSYDYLPCADGAPCINGACACKKGVLSCSSSGNAVMLCGMDSMLHLDHNCPMGSSCKAGLCVDTKCQDETMNTNPNALPTNAWPRYRHDNRNTGYTDTPVADMPKMKWKVAIGGGSLNNNGLGSAPVVNQKNIIFMGSGNTAPGNGAFMSFDATGKQIYTFPANRGFGSSTPAVRLDGSAYFSSQDANLYAVDPTGKQLWNYKTGSQADGDPIVTKDGILIYSSDDGSLYALDGTGKLLWKSNSQTGPGEVDGGLAESCDGQIYAAGRNGWFGMDAKTGNINWKQPALGATNAILSSPVVDAMGTMWGFDSGGQGIAIDAKGNVLWKKMIGPGTGFGGCSAGKAGNTIYTFLGDGKVYAVDAMTGAVKWSQPAGRFAREINAAPIIDGKQRVYFGGNDGFVYAWDANGTQLWKMPTSGVDNQSMDLTGTCAIGNDGTLYVPANDGSLYAFQ